MGLTLAELIARLKQEPGTTIVGLGFCNPHWYRGDYNDLAFEPATNVTVGSMLACAAATVGAKLPHFYRGGDYTVDESVDVHLAWEGHVGEPIGPLFLELMLKSIPYSVDLQSISGFSVPYDYEGQNAAAKGSSE